MGQGHASQNSETGRRSGLRLEPALILNVSGFFYAGNRSTRIVYVIRFALYKNNIRSKLIVM